MSEDRGPIFIGGLSHSGKTQLRLVLGAHPEISMTRRTYMWDRFYERFGDLGRARNLERCLSAMLQTEGVRRLQPDVDRIRGVFREGPFTYGRLFGLFHQHHAERLGKRRWGDQLGFVERFADPIFAAFPSARMIHMIRDPRKRAAYGAATARRRRGSLGWETARWLHSADLAERNCKTYPDRYQVVRYEQLASRTEGTVRELCAFLDETYVSSMTEALEGISFGTDAGAEYLAPETSRADVAFVEALAGRQLLAFEYPVIGPSRPGAFLLVDRATMIVWRILASKPLAGRARGRV